MDFLTNPGVMDSEKADFLGKVMGGRFSQELQDFVKVLLDKKRIGYLVDIADHIRVNYAREGAVETIVTSAYPLETDLLSELKKRLEKKIGRPVRLYTAMDPALRGGLKVVMGNKVMDWSIQKRLAELKDKLRALNISITMEIRPDEVTSIITRGDR